jgi:ribosomal protein L1
MAGKRYENALKKIDRTKRYTIAEACVLLPQLKAPSKKKADAFDETVDVAIRGFFDRRGMLRRLADASAADEGQGGLPQQKDGPACP